MRNHPKKDRIYPLSALSLADYQALAAFRLSLREFLAFSAAAARAAGLTPQQHQALLAIKGAPAGEMLSIQDLSAHLHIKHNTTVELLDRLEKAKLVRRRRDLANRRQVRIALTARAERLLQRLSAAHLKELQAMRPALLTLLKQLD